MKKAIRKGFSFGLTSGVITTLGLMVGINSAVHSKLAVIGAILTIAIADSLSDALGLHMSEESEAKHSQKTIWLITYSTAFYKFIFALSFLIPILIFKELGMAILIGILWGILLLTLLSYRIAKREKISPRKAIFEHLMIAVIVIILTYYLGILVANVFV